MLLNRERAYALMERDGIDALVAMTPENVLYLSDYGNQHTFHFGPWGLAAAILPRDPDLAPTLIAADWELPHLSERPSWMPELEVITGLAAYIPDGTPLSAQEQGVVEMWQRGNETGLPNRSRLIARTLERLGLERAVLALDDPRAILEFQAEALQDADLVEGINLFREIRIVKTPEELERLSVAAHKNQAALQSMAAMIAEGVSTGQLLNHYLAAMAAQGGYGSHSTGGGRDRPWHTYPDPTYRLRKGDVYVLDPAGHYDYYWADMGRAAEVGGPSAKFEHLFGTLQETMAAVTPMLRPGVSTAEIKAESLRVAAPAMPGGLSPLLHSIGIEQYDHPQSPGNFLSEDFVLEADMVVNYEIPYMEFPWGMLQLEDSYHITPSGPERLVELPQEPFYPAARAASGPRPDTLTN